MKGLKRQMKIDGRMGNNIQESLCSIDEVRNWEEVQKFWDDLSGRELNKEGVTNARIEELGEFNKHQVYDKVPEEECWRNTGKKPIGTRWVDVNK